VKVLKGKFQKQPGQYATVEERKRELGQILKDTYSFIQPGGLCRAVSWARWGGERDARLYSAEARDGPWCALPGRDGANEFLGLSPAGPRGWGLIGAVLGAALGVSVQLILPAVLKDFLPVRGGVLYFVGGGRQGRDGGAGDLPAVHRCLPLLTVPARLAVARDPVGAGEAQGGITSPAIAPLPTAAHEI